MEKIRLELTTPPPLPLTIRVNQEYADLVPEMSTEEYESFKQDIKEHGLLVPITVNQEGVILDGHHRFKTCQQLGIECKFEPPKSFDDQLEEEDYVIGVNVARRNLTEVKRGVLVFEEKSD